MNPNLTNKLDTTLLIFGIVIFAAVLTWIVPAGSYERETVEIQGVGLRDVIVAGSFSFLDTPTPQGISAVLTAPLNGFIAAADIIGFVLIVGGAFGIFFKTGAVDAGIRRIVSSASTNRFIEVSIVPILMIIFSLGGATYGMAEEILPMILVFVPLSRALGYDTIVGVAIPYIGASVGFAAAPLNPFTVGIAQGIAEIPLFSGQGLRWGLWFVCTAIAISFVMVYAIRVKKDPAKSLVYGFETTNLTKFNEVDVANTILNAKHKLVLLAFVIGMVSLVFGVLVYGWYIVELSGLFLLIGIVVGLLGGLTAKDSSMAFVDGASSLLKTALIIGLARAILVVLENGQIIDTILNALANSIDGLSPIVTAQLMFLTQTVINFFVPSGSGQAALTMPLMAPLSDLVGVTRQTAVLAFQMGDGFTNMIIPTNAVLMGALTISGVTWQTWARWVIPLQLILMIIGLMTLAIAVSIGWGV